MAPRHQTFPLDLEILRYLTRAGYARPDAVVAWTGASAWGVRKAYRRLADAGMVRADPVPLDLRDAHGAVRATVATAWTATGRGANSLGAHHVPGTEHYVELGPPRVGPAMARHTVGAAGLAAAYRRAGFQVAFERDVVALERPTVIGARQLGVIGAWTVQVTPTMRGVRPPDLGVMRDGQKYVVELERTTNRSASDYTEIVSAWAGAGFGQVWHVERERTWKQLLAGMEAAGIRLRGTGTAGVAATEDGSVRVAGWVPGRVLAGPATWAPTPGELVPPVGFAPPAEPVVLDAWRQGTIVDTEAPLWEPVRMIQAA